MSEQRTLIEEPKPTGPGKDPEVCGTCRYLDWVPVDGATPRCCVDNNESPQVWLERPGCQRYVHREIRRDR